MSHDVIHNRNFTGALDLRVADAGIDDDCGAEGFVVIQRKRP